MPNQYTKMELRPVAYVVGPSIAYIELTQGQWALIDSDQAEGLGSVNWYAQWNPKTGSFYAVKSNGKGVLLMHRVVLGLTDKKMIGDHRRSQSTLDNRLANLRSATAYENAQNRRRQKHNKSGYKGVHWCKLMKGWSAAISCNGKRRVIGYFASPQQAFEAYCEEAKVLHRDFAKLN